VLVLSRSSKRGRNKVCFHVAEGTKLTIESKVPDGMGGVKTVTTTYAEGVLFAEIEVQMLQKTRVSFGIRAPKALKVLREELPLTSDELRSTK
jgi:hypothetical protein